jgi:glycosyltransferase involved in cell wall biosynthesis
MRVLQFGRFWNDQHGGVERHVHLLSKGLAAQGVEVVNLVAAPDFHGRDEYVDGFRLVQAPSFGMAFRTAMSPALIYKALQLHREKPFDIFHLHLQDPLSHLASALLPSNVKRVITWHHDIVRQKRLLRLYQPLLRRVMLQVDAVIAATAAHFSSSLQIPSEIRSEKRHVIPYGIDFEALKLDERTSEVLESLRQRAQGRSLVFALGRHVAYKGFDLLIEAMRTTEAVLVLGGTGPLTDELKRQAVTLGVDKRVIFTGRIPEEDLPAYFHGCDVFCLSSINQMEAFGLVQLEAMACAKPVVCTQLNNGVNVVNVDGDTGLAVPVGDPNALARALKRLMQDAALRDRMGQAGYKRARGVFSLDSMALSHVRLYQDLLRTSR